MKPVVAMISDPALAKRLGAKQMVRDERGLYAAKESEIIIISGKAAFSWPMERCIILERMMAVSVRKFENAIKAVRAQTKPDPKKLTSRRNQDPA